LTDFNLINDPSVEAEKFSQKTNDAVTNKIEADLVVVIFFKDEKENKVEYGIRVIWSGDLVKEGIARKLEEETEQLSISGNTPAKNYLKKN